MNLQSYNNVDCQNKHFKCTTLIIDKGGRVYGRGYNGFHIISSENTNNIKEWTRIYFKVPIVMVSLQDACCVALGADQKLWFSGSLVQEYPIGAPPIPIGLRQLEIGNDERFVSVVSGYSHSLAVDISGNMWHFGRNTSGQIGSGDSDPVKEFTLNTNIPFKIKSVSASANNSLAIDTRGMVWYFCPKKYVPVPISEMGISGYVDNLNFGSVSCGQRDHYLLVHDGTVFALVNIESAVRNTITDDLCIMSMYNVTDTWGIPKAKSIHPFGKSNIIHCIDNTFWGLGDNRYQQLSPFTNQYSQYLDSRCVQLPIPENYVVSFTGKLYVMFVNTLGELFICGCDHISSIYSVTSFAHSYLKKIQSYQPETISRSKSSSKTSTN